MKLILFAPELILLLGGLLLFSLSLCKRRAGLPRRLTRLVALAATVACALTLHAQGTLFFDAYRIDLFSQLMKCITCAGFAAALFASSSLTGVAEEIRAEYYFFLILSSLGLVLLVSSADLLTMFISLELSSYSLYLLVPMRDDRQGLRIQMESAIKYILFGVAATGVMLFGMSYLFGLTGTITFHQLLPALRPMMHNPAALAAIAMTLGGFFFKLTVFPFHFWAPDVYQGASNETAAFIASVPKVAAVGLLVRIASLATPDGSFLVLMLATLSVCSMFYGNLAALVQTDVKRMLGFSGIAHAGYIMLGLVTLGETGYATAIYYVIGYLVMILAGFLVVCAVSKDGENVLVSDLNGLYKRSPLLAFTLAVSMFAMAGIPPFAGFMGKFMLLTAAYKAGFLPLVIIAVVNTAISIYYYLCVVKAAYSGDPGDSPGLAVAPSTKAASALLTVVTVALGVMPDRVLAIATEAVKAIL
ncbi:MAG: NADH-quinone oxidoreductase subunit N [Betaproteobacteria bacterium]|nr:NADH-quinone oxidoreductase subunit N [Betaproteobacteria bacterium]